MLWTILFIAVASADQVTQYTINYGSYSVPGTMTEDDSGTRIVFSTDQSRMDDIVVDYNSNLVILTSGRRQTCAVLDITTEIKTIVEKYRKQIHETSTMEAIYFKLASTKPTSQTDVQEQLVTDVCGDYSVQYKTLVSIGTTPPKQRGGCLGLSWGKWCVGIGNGK